MAPGNEGYGFGPTLGQFQYWAGALVMSIESYLVRDVGTLDHGLVWRLVPKLYSGLVIQA